MSDEIANTEVAASQTVEDTDEVPEQEATQPVDEIAILRKRQSGADAARRKAEERLAAAEQELERYRSQDRERQQADMTAEARLQAELEAARRRADEAEAKASARVLDTLYPKARAKFPEVRDETKLAELEALYADIKPAPEPDTARSMRAPKDSANSGGGEPAELTSKDLLARLRSIPYPGS